MSLYHRCHTCGAEYPCNARWCPQCGKRLGHRDERGTSNQPTVEICYGTGISEMYRCASCGEVSMDVYRPRHCTHCGARFVGFIDSAKMAEVRREREKLRQLFMGAAK